MREVELATLKEQTVGLQRQVNRLHDLIAKEFASLDELTQARFVTYRTLIDSQAERVKLALEASDKAITKQEVATEKRFESVNEFRAQLNDQARELMPRSEHAVELMALSDRIARIEEVVKEVQIWQGNITGRLAVGGILFTVVMAVIVFVANLMTKG